MSTRPRIVAGIPAYNEEKYIAKVVLKTKRYVDEVLVVDDGSTDMTAEIARALGATVVSHTENRGYGAALQTIFREARLRDPDVLVVLDADDQHDPDEIPRLVEPILRGEADIVIGSRFLGAAQQPSWRLWGVKLITWLVKKSHGIPHGITDAQSGFRAYSRRALHLIMPQDSEMGASIDILVQAAEKGLRVREVPVTIRYHSEASSQNSLVHAARVIMRNFELLAWKKPLLYLGLPGVTAAGLSIALIAYTLHITNTVGRVPVLAAAASAALFTAGSVMLMAATALHIAKQAARLKQ